MAAFSAVPVLVRRKHARLHCSHSQHAAGRQVLLRMVSEAASSPQQQSGYAAIPRSPELVSFQHEHSTLFTSKLSVCTTQPCDFMQGHDARSAVGLCIACLYLPACSLLGARPPARSHRHLHLDRVVRVVILQAKRHKCGVRSGVGGWVWLVVGHRSKRWDTCRLASSNRGNGLKRGHPVSHP